MRRVKLMTPRVMTAAPTAVTGQRLSPSPNAEATTPPLSTTSAGKAQQSAKATSATGPAGNLSLAIGYAAQHESISTSVVKLWAVSLMPSAMVR